MNKKGFTLIELLVTIVILSIVITIATTAVLSIVARVNNNAYNVLITKIKSAAENYTTDTNKKLFFIQELIEKGYIEADDENGYIYNPKEKSIAMNCFPIEIEFENRDYNVYITEESYEISNKTCDDNRLVNSQMNFSISTVKKTGNTYDITVNCPTGYYLIISSNNGYYKTVANTTLNSYTYTTTVTMTTTFTASLKLDNQNVIKTRTATIKI